MKGRGEQWNGLRVTGCKLKHLHFSCELPGRLFATLAFHLRKFIWRDIALTIQIRVYIRCIAPALLSIWGLYLVPNRNCAQMVDGKPVYYKGYKAYLSDENKTEEPIGSSLLQSMIISNIVVYLYNKIK